jgi:hypothetical protein
LGSPEPGVELVRLVVSELKDVGSLSPLELEVGLVRLVVSELKVVSPLSFSKLGLELVRRMMLDYARLTIST